MDFDSDGEGGAGNAAGKPTDEGGSRSSGGAGLGGASFGGAGGAGAAAGKGGTGNHAGAGGTTGEAGGALGGAAGEAGLGGEGGAAPSDACMVVVDGGDSKQYHRIRLDEESQVLTQEQSRSPNFNPIDYREQQLLESEERHLVVLGGIGGNMPFRFDNFYNEQGDLIAYLATYTSEMDFSVTPSGPHYGASEYSHEYVAGRLIRTETTSSQSGSLALYDFQEDEQGRCTEIVTTDGDDGWRETRSYEGTRVTGVRRVRRLGGEDHEVLITIEYDELGRPTLFAEDGSASFWFLEPDGDPDIFRRYEYADDGSATLTLLDFTSDVTNTTVDRNGVETDVYREEMSFSAECAALLTVLFPVVDHSCRFRAAARPSVVQPSDVLR